MAEDIENCLRPVISAVKESPGAKTWAIEMLRQDRIGVLCERELREMAG